MPKKKRKEEMIDWIALLTDTYLASTVPLGVLRASPHATQQLLFLWRGP